MKKIIIFGSSGHAKVVIDIVEKEGKYQIAGIIDNLRVKGDTLLGYEILGNDDDVPEIIAKHSVFGALIAIGNNFQREKVTSKIKSSSPGLTIISTIHPDAVIAKEVSIAEGCVIMAGTIIGPSSLIEDGCIINSRSSLDHDCSLGRYSSLAPGVTTGGNVSIGDYSAIGIKTAIAHGLKIGEQTVIGAGSTVLHDIPSHQVAYGTPARPIRHRNTCEPYL